MTSGYGFADPDEARARSTAVDGPTVTLPRRAGRRSPAGRLPPAREPGVLRRSSRNSFSALVRPLGRAGVDPGLALPSA